MADDPGRAPRPRGLLKIRAYDKLKRRITRGQLGEGELLSERQLARELGMSNSPVRWAIERLETEGYIEIAPQRGFLVRELSNAEIAEHYECREILEPAVVRRVAGRLSAARVERLRDNLHAQTRSWESGEIAEFVHRDALFHLLLCEFLDNRELLRFVHQLSDRIFRVILRVAQTDPGRLEQSIREHEEIADAVVKGDGETAARLVHDHLERGRTSLLDSRRR